MAESANEHDSESELRFPGCPTCKFALVESGDELECPGCGAAFSGVSA